MMTMLIAQHRNVLTCSAFTMSKGLCILGTLTIYMRTEINFDSETQIEMFRGRYELLQINHGDELNNPGYFRKAKSVKIIQSDLRNDPKQLGFCFFLILLALAI